MAFVSLRSLSFSYPSSPEPVLKELSLDIEAGEYLAVVGPNGSGKSSLLRVLAGLLKAPLGQVFVDGLDRSGPGGQGRKASTLALVFQAPLDQIVSSVVEEDVAFGPENLGLPRKAIRERVGQALALTGLEAEAQSPSLFLSAGQQQRLAIAGALAMEPRCIAFDEATAMLDPEGRAAVLDLIDELNARGITIVHVTHDMDEAARARRVLALESGRLAYDGSPEGFFLPGSQGKVPALELGLEVPESVAAALALGLPPRLGEEPKSLAARLLKEKKITATKIVDLPTGKASEPAYVLEAASLLRQRGGGLAREALSSVDLTLPKAQLTALVGKTGSGKSSLLELLDALSFPTNGRVLSLGQDTQAKGSDLRALRMASPLAVQRPEAALFEAYAGDDVAFGPRNQGLSGNALVQRVKASMEALGLGYGDFRDRGTRGLSGGEKRRLALAGVLALDSEALLLDEPTSALDPENRGRVRSLFGGLKAEGKTVVLSTHSMDEAAQADLVVVLGDGRVLALAPPRELFYSLFNEAWGLKRPYAVDLALALGALGLDLSGPGASRPLTLPELAGALGVAV